MRSLILAAGILGLVLMSGYVTVNIDHHMHLPPELSTKNTLLSTHHIRIPNIFKGDTTFLTKHTDVYLVNEIKDEKVFTQLIYELSTATKYDSFTFHIAGVGGQVDTAFLIINNIKSTKAHTKMIVEEPSYSGHSFIALAGNELEMMPFTYLMFHTTSAYAFDCTAPKANPTVLDRGVPNVEHCTTSLQYHVGLVHAYIDQLVYLTVLEKERIKTGHDVYLTAGDYYNRIGAVK